MKDLSTEFKDVSEEIKEYYPIQQNPITDKDWKNIDHYIFYTDDGNYLLVGYMNKNGVRTWYAIYIIEFELEEVIDEETYKKVVDIVNKHIADRTIYLTQGYHKPNEIGTSGLVYNSMATIGYFNYISSNFDIVHLIRSSYDKADFYSKLFNWEKFSEMMDSIDQEAKTCEYDEYPHLLEFYPLFDMDFTFMILSKDEYAKKQYLRYIDHLRIQRAVEDSLR